MSDAVLWIENKEEFAGIVDSAHEVVVDFTAPGWCRPCQQFAPHFDAAATKSDATFIAVDVDKAPWAMEDFGVQSVPTVIHFVNGVQEKVLKERTAVKLLKEIS